LGGEANAVTRRELLPAALVLLVTITDAAHASTLSFYLLLAAVPCIVVAGLASLEELVQPDARPYRRAVGILHIVVLVLVLVAAALRAPLRAEGTVPRAAVSAVIACLVVFAIQAVIGALPAIKRTLARQRLGGVAALGLQPPVGGFFGDDALAEPSER
jgi:hypothetical protein